MRTSAQDSLQQRFLHVGTLKCHTATQSSTILTLIRATPLTERWMPCMEKSGNKLEEALKVWLWPNASRAMRRSRRRLPLPEKISGCQENMLKVIPESCAAAKHTQPLASSLSDKSFRSKASRQSCKCTRGIGRHT